MNLKLRHLLTKRTLYHLAYVTSSSPFISPLPLISHLQNPNSSPQFPPLFSKPYHSSPFLNCSTSQSSIATLNEELDPDSTALNEFLARFANPMRLKLREIYEFVDERKLNGILEVIVDKIVGQFEKGEKLEDFNTKKENFWDDLWRDVIQVCDRVYVEMEREKTKEKMKKFLQCDQVKEMARFASEVGVRGDLLRELRFKWAREAMEESEFYTRLESLRGEGEGEGVGEVDESERIAVRKKWCSIGKVGLVKRQGKIKFMIYGLDLSDSKWKEMADKVHDTEEDVWGLNAKVITGKAQVVTDKIVSIENDKELVPLLNDWKELVQPSRVDWVSLLDKVKSKGLEGLYLKAAEHVLSEPSFQADIQDYARLIDIYGKWNHLEDAERIHEKMIANGMTPNVIVLTFLFHMYTKAGKFVQAKESFEALRSQGFEPDVGVYSSMIMTCVDAGEVKQGEELLNKLETLDMKPAEDVYMALLRGYAKRGDVKGAHRIETTMVFAGYQPNLEFYTLLVETYARNNNVKGARNIFDYMMQSGFKPDDKCIAVMISAYAKKNELDTALHLLLKLEKEKIELGMSTYCVLLDWFGKLQLVDEAEQFLGKIAQLGEAPPFKIQVSLCDMYSRAQNEKKALQYLGVLEAKKELLEADDFERVIQGLTKGGFMQEASRMRGLMEAQGFTVTESVNFMTQTFTRGNKKPGAI